MNRNLALMIIFVVFLSMLTLAFDDQSVKAEPETWTVDDNGPADFSTIQEAINAASDGGTIFVRMGTYYENIVVNRTVVLTGEDSSTTIIDGNGTGHVVIITSHGVNMTGFTVQNSGTAYHITGINLNNVNHCNVSGNIITNNEHGLEIHNSSYYNTICGNNMTENNKWGMHIIDSHYNNVSWNIIGGSIWGSIAIHGFSTHNRIFENNVGNNDNGGISIDGSNYNDIYENNITNNLWGISVQYGANYNAISRNNIANNNYSFKLEWNTYANMFCHNNLVGNAFPTSIVGNNNANSWDDGYPSGGNYWSDYAGVDLGPDGIGDTEYVIDSDNIDHYPLMGVFHSFNTSLGCSVDVVSNSTIESFEYFESNSTIKMYVSNMTANQKFGFCRVRIPHALMNDTYHITINGAEPYYWNYTLYDDGNNRWIYFSYQHSTLEIIIISEFLSFLILLLFMIVTLLAVIVHKRRHVSLRE